jgi:hypothetical protein
MKTDRSGELSELYNRCMRQYDQEIQEGGRDFAAAQKPVHKSFRITPSASRQPAGVATVLETRHEPEPAQRTQNEVLNAPMEVMKKTVPPAYEVDYMNVYGAFGWSVKDTREVYNQSSHLEADGDDINQVTTTTHYVTILFERSTGLRNYGKIAALQKKMDAVFDPDPRLIPPIVYGKVFLILTILLFTAGLAGISGITFSGTVEIIICFLLCGSLAFWRLYRVNKWRSVVAANINKRDEIVAQARRIK